MRFFYVKIKNKIQRMVGSKFNKRLYKRHALVGPPELWNLKRNFQIGFLQNVAGLQPDHYLCDIGCGTLRGGIPIIKYLEKGHYFGLDVREEIFHEAYLELRDNLLEYKNPILICMKDFSEIHLNQTFDRMWAFSVLIHMPDEALFECLKFVRSHLSRTGIFYANVNITQRQESRWREFPIINHSLKFYENLGLKCGMKATALGTLDTFGHKTGYPDQDKQVMLEFRLAS